MTQMEPRHLKEELRIVQLPPASDDVAQIVSYIDHTLYAYEELAKTRTSAEQDMNQNNTYANDWNALLMTHDSKASVEEDKLEWHHQQRAHQGEAE